jgi:formamidopyrimidine-DNA glycosylase
VPERPDLEYVVPILNRDLPGGKLAAVRVPKPIVLRLAVEGTPETLLVGRRFGAVTRRAHFVLFELDGTPELELVVSPMLAGRFALGPADAKKNADLAMAFTLEDGRELRYRDDVQMGKVYVVPKGAWNLVPGLEMVGLDVLNSKVFSRAAFRKLAKTRRDQVKVFLMDKSALDAMGNAYADEVLWEAKLHPKTMVRSLDEAQVDALHDAIAKVIGNATKVIAKRAPPLDEKLRDFLNVRGRNGQPCPRCGTTIRSAGVHGHDAEFCPACQVDERSSSIVDWRKVPKKP